MAFVIVRMHNYAVHRIVQKNLLTYRRVAAGSEPPCGVAPKVLTKFLSELQPEEVRGFVPRDDHAVSITREPSLTSSATRGSSVTDS